MINYKKKKLNKKTNILVKTSYGQATVNPVHLVRK